MANQSLKTLEIAFEKFVDTYESNLVLSKAASVEILDPKDSERGGDVDYIRQNYEAQTVSGLDVSGETDMDVIDRAVPFVMQDPENVIFNLNSKEARDPTKMEKQGEAAAKSLAAYVDQYGYNRAVSRAGITVTGTGAFDWDMGADAETQAIMRGISMSEMKLFMNPVDWKSVAGELGARQFTSDRTKAAYERSMVPDIANFETYRTDNVVNVAAKGTVTGTTVNGAQSHTVTAKDANGVPVDNRIMPLTVQGANIANIKAGDRFTVANVKAVHMKTKSDTNILQVFTVVAVAGSGTTLTVSPAIVSSGPYQNVTVAAANSAAVAFVNNNAAPANLFFAKEAVQFKYSRLEFPSDMGPKVMTANTESGIPLVMSYSFDDRKGKVSIRYHTFFGADAVDSDKVGIILANQ